MKNRVAIAELEGRVNVLEATIERMDADRRTFVRHQQTLARHMRRILGENRELRAAKHTLIRYIESASRLEGA